MQVFEENLSGCILLTFSNSEVSLNNAYDPYQLP
jgi:hypothetical protein